MSFKLVRSEKVYNGRAFSIRRDQVLLPDNRKADLDIVEHIGSVVILPIDAEGNILFVSQYRHAVARDFLELPAGTLEPGEEAKACALREIREETGMSAGMLEPLGGFFLAPGYSTEYMQVFLAENLLPEPLDPDADEFLRVIKIPVQQALELAMQGKLPDAKSLAAFHLAGSYLTKYL